LGVTNLFALVFAGMFVMTLCSLIALVLVVHMLSGRNIELPRPNLKRIVRPSSPTTTPSLVKPPTEKTTIGDEEPLAGPDGVTHIDTEKKTEYRELNEVPKTELMEAVGRYLGGKDAVAAAVDEAEATE
jgi:hypothetical protein